MRIPLPSTKKRARIEIIPLIDIIFFLLATFVMVSLSMVHNQGISVNLPVAATAASQEGSKTVTLSVDDKGGIYMDKEPVTFDAMAVRLQQLKKSDPGLKVLINGDDKADFGKAVGILDEVRKLGITKIAIRTKKDPAAKGN